ncbi:Zn(2)-C6 fungal-type domain-containing protein [Mycena chlorophos]|uniref:Zn(2)-C6 fungal-type domain-containing protein n=1 Tax=Mycena chlorophos TaxID=658473 RepID=A0A8H6TK84_MYCCL|nr:Zn(2)-C6 fungal-type domain-containing protein [Mycena chlorophos]
MSSSKPTERHGPACDSCKAKRVRCFKVEEGQPCPRCVEKQLVCKTTYIPRGRPRKVPSPKPSGTQNLNNAMIHAPARNQLDTRASLGLLANPDTVKHLYFCFAHQPLRRHPLFTRVKAEFEKVLSAASWRLDLLHPQAFTLAHCFCAVAAAISFHPDIIGPEDCPTSLTDPTYFYLGADLRKFGLRRAEACRMLYQRALYVAGDARVQSQASEFNALSCFLLDSLEGDIETNTRPWAASYMSHARALMASWPDGKFDRAVWTGFFFSEVSRALLNRGPVLVQVLLLVVAVSDQPLRTFADQLLAAEGDPPSLESFLEKAHKEAAAPSPKPRLKMCLELVEPFMFHATRMGREFFETVSGDFARRRPVSELAVRKLLDELTTMQALMSYCFTGVDFPDETSLQEDASRPETSPGIRGCAFGMSIMFTGLIIVVHDELKLRSREAIRELPSSVSSNHAPWSSSRLALLQSQARSLALSALPDIIRAVKLQMFPLYGLVVMWTQIMRWAEFCADEADLNGGIDGISGVENVNLIEVFERMLYALKGIGYSSASPRLDTLIERLEAHVMVYRRHHKLEPATNAVPLSSPPASTAKMDLDPSLFVQPIEPELAFLLDGFWMSGTGSSTDRYGLDTCSRRHIEHSYIGDRTLADQLLVSQGTPPPLESFLDRAHKEAASEPSLKHRVQLCFELVTPFVFHGTRRGREFFENVSGHFARHQPLSESAIHKALDDLGTMQALLSYCFSEIDFPDTTLHPDSKDEAARPTNAQQLGMAPRVRIVAYGMSVVFTGFVLVLYTELEHRASEAREDVPPSGQHVPWAQSRLALLRAQVTSLALSSLPDVLRVLKLQPFPLYGLAVMWTQIMRWGALCADAADLQGGIAGMSGIENVNLVEVFERLMYALKGIGYSSASPHLDKIIQRLETHISAYRQHHNSPAHTTVFPSSTSESTPEVDFDLALLAQPMPDMAFLLHGSWMTGNGQMAM